MEKDRETQRKQRLKSSLPLVSLVGYTNAGKSTVMNALVDRYACGEEKKVLEKDMLFATLETTVRKMEGEGGKSFLLSDTVGFIDELPHNLVKAFRSTLEEVKNADLLVQVIDYSDDSYREHRKVTEKTLEELGAGKIPVICVFNKLDLKDGEEYPRIVGNNIFMAAGKRAGIEELISLIEKNLFGKRKKYEMLIPYTAGSAFSDLSGRTLVEEYEYREEGIYVRAALDEKLAGRYKKFLQNES